MYEKTNTALSPIMALFLTLVVTSATLFGLATGKKMEKVPFHIEVPSRRRYSHSSSTD